MDMMLTSFGLSHVAPEKENHFFRLPPYTLALANRQLMSDFSMLLLCDQVIVDHQSFDRLMDSSTYNQWQYADLYAQTAKLLRVLHEEGFVRLENFEAVIDSNRSLLEQMLEVECRSIDVWVPSLKESIASWKASFQMIFNTQLENCFPDSSSKEDFRLFRFKQIRTLFS